MPRYLTGQPVTISTPNGIRVAGVLTDPTVITLELLRPDLTTTVYTTATSPAVIRDSVGQFHIDLGALTAGHYEYAWVTTGVAAGTRQDRFDVDTRLTVSHVSFGDARDRLNVSTLADAELDAMIASAVAEQEQSVGPVAPRTVTRTVYPSSGVLLLPAPVVSVTSITPVGGSALSLAGLDLSGLSAGIVRPGTLGGFWASSYTVVLVAGRNPVPQDLVEAALLRVQHSYETQRGPAELPLADAVEGGGSAFILMLRARDKEAPYVIPAVA